MRRVVDGCSFADWWDRFRPSREWICSLVAPGRVSDASDPKIVHLHGLNLSRAWCWRQLLPELDMELQVVGEEAIERHLAASLHARPRRLCRHALAGVVCGVALTEN